MKHIAIVGSRQFQNEDLVKRAIEILFYKYGKDNIVIVSGGARGVDSIAQKYSESIGVQTLIFKADWKRYGYTAGFLRNTTIVENSDCVLAFWDEKSTGTLDTLNKSKLAGLSIVVLNEQGKIIEEWKNEIKPKTAV